MLTSSTAVMETVLRPRRVPNVTAPGDEREQRVVLAQADVLARVHDGAALADEDHARLDRLAAELLDAVQSLRVGIAPVLGRGLALFVRHGLRQPFDDVA